MTNLCEMTNTVLILSRRHFISRERNTRRIKAFETRQHHKQQGLTWKRSPFRERSKPGKSKSKSLGPLGNKSVCMSDWPFKRCCLERWDKMNVSAALGVNFVTDHEQSKQKKRKREIHSFWCHENKQSHPNDSNVTEKSQDGT